MPGVRHLLNALNLDLGTQSRQRSDATLDIIPSGSTPFALNTRNFVNEIHVMIIDQTRPLLNWNWSYDKGELDDIHWALRS